MGQLRGWQGEWERERDGMRMGESGDGGLGEVTIDGGSGCSQGGRHAGKPRGFSSCESLCLSPVSVIKTQ